MCIIHVISFIWKGNKYIIRGDIDGEPCEKNRYQPFKFQTDGYNKCIFEKSVCNEEGQIAQNSGNTTADTSCRCDYTKGYRFVIEPTNKCYCRPTHEDCSCYKKKCRNNEFLNPSKYNDKLSLTHIYMYIQTNTKISGQTVYIPECRVYVIIWTRIAHLVKNTNQTFLENICRYNSPLNALYT